MSVRPDTMSIEIVYDAFDHLIDFHRTNRTAVINDWNNSLFMGEGGGGGNVENSVYVFLRCHARRFLSHEM